MVLPVLNNKLNLGYGENLLRAYMSCDLNRIYVFMSFTMNIKKKCDIFPQIYVIFLAYLKTIVFRVFSLNMLFTYLWVSYNVLKLQTYSSLYS